MKRLVIVLLLAWAWTTTPALAFPDKPIRLVVPAAAGGGADILGRTLAQHLSQTLGQPVVVENRTGAGGNVAAEVVVRAPKDGYTLLLADTAQLAINPTLYKSIAFDPQRDFEPISRVASFPFLLVVHPSLGVKSVADLIAAARAKPDKLSYASTGVGTPQHLGGEMFRQMVDVSLVHVPYRGGAPALADLVAGQVPIGFIGIPPTLPHLQKGSLLALAVSSAKRSPALPNVPTMDEAGLRGYEALVWFAVVGPAGMPATTVARLAAAIREAIDDKAVRERLHALGYEPAASEPRELAALIASETVKWRALVKSSGASAD